MSGTINLDVMASSMVEEKTLIELEMDYINARCYHTKAIQNNIPIKEQDRALKHYMDCSDAYHHAQMRRNK